MFIKLGSNKGVLLDYTYHIIKTVFQNYNTNENPLSNYGLEFVFK